MRVLFLDIDGVILPSQFQKFLCDRWEKSKGELCSRDEYGFFFDPTCMHFLAEIFARTNCRFVISSSWRHRLGQPKLYEMWARRRMPGMIYDVTEHTGFPRGEEIELWLSQNDVDSYCIVDDCVEMLPEQLPFFVKTDSRIGITKSDMERIVQILNS